MSTRENNLGWGTSVPKRAAVTTIDRTGWALADFPQEEQDRMIAEMKELEEKPIPEPVLQHLRVDSARPTTGQSALDSSRPTTGTCSKDDSSGILSKLLGDA